jgi:hypothetical protein
VAVATANGEHPMSCLLVTTPLRGVGRWLLTQCGDLALREVG